MDTEASTEIANGENIISIPKKEAEDDGAAFTNIEPLPPAVDASILGNGSLESAPVKNVVIPIKIEVVPEVCNGEWSPPKRVNFQKNPLYHGTGRLPCPELGENWMIEQIVRQQGKSAGRYDTYYYSPDGVRLRSKLKLQEKIGRDLANFDYNAGKYINKEGDEDMGPQTAKMKIYSLKTRELKTVDRHIMKKSPTPKKHSEKPGYKNQVKGPYAVLLQSYEKRKNQRRIRPKPKKRKKDTAKKEIFNVIDMINEDKEQNYEFNVFKQEALMLSDHFTQRGDEFKDLLQFAWNFLSIESKTQFNALNIDSSSPFVCETPPTPPPPSVLTEPYAMSSFNPDVPSTSRIIKHPRKIIVYPRDCLRNLCNQKRSLKKHKRRPVNRPPMPKRRRCEKCKGCLSQNCGACVPCRDMKKFGGTGTKKQSCVQRRCEAIHSPSAPVSMAPQQSFFNPYSYSQPLIGRTPLMSRQKYSTFPESRLGDNPFWPRPNYMSDNSFVQKDPEILTVGKPERLRTQASLCEEREIVNSFASNTSIGLPSSMPTVFNQKIVPSESPFVRNMQPCFPFNGIVPQIISVSAADDRARLNMSSSSSNTSTDSSVSLEQKSSQKVHKRKSRVPVYISQESNTFESAV